jgi:Fur family ferric uptake transcriptional regulator
MVSIVVADGPASATPWAAHGGDTRHGGTDMKRRTTQRTAIEEVLSRHDRPLGVEEILKFGRLAVESLNQATVYRNLKLLVENGAVTVVNHPTLGTLYESTHRGHHHHFHCLGCNRVFELPGCVLREENLVPKGFVVKNHEVFLSGICPSCSGQA